MNWYGSGFITVIIYGTFGEAEMQDDAILTEDNFDLLTEDGQELMVE